MATGYAGQGLKTSQAVGQGGPWPQGPNVNASQSPAGTEPKGNVSPKRSDRGSTSLVPQHFVPMTSHLQVNSRSQVPGTG